jgi:error-prone DNA polymerase
MAEPPRDAVVVPLVPDRPAGPRWAELHVHSAFSFLRGAADPAELVAEAARLGVGVLALTDRDGLYGARRLADAARPAGIGTVFGAELTLDEAELGTPVVLARDLEGFRRLSAAISAAQLAGAKGAPRYDLHALAAAARGGHWAVLPGCPAPPSAAGPPSAPRLGAPSGTTPGPAAPYPGTTPGPPGPPQPARDPWQPARAAERLVRLAEVFGADAVHAELTDHRLPGDTVRNDAMAAAARRIGCPVVATGAVHYAVPGQARLAQALTALRRREDLSRAAGHLMPAPTAHLRSAAEMHAAFARYPGVAEATVELGRRCVTDLRALRPELPGFPTPEGYDEDRWLRELAEDACARRFGPRADPAAGAAWRQLDHELTVTGELGMAGYFLIVHDIVEHARGSGIWCQGRGSAASSVVCYVLGITHVDPIRHGLLFERFLSAEKAGPPDIDLDFEHNRREEVIQYVYRRYGRGHAAQVANIITYQPRLAVRDAARALGYPPSRIDEMTQRIHHHQPPPPDADVPGDVRELAARLHTLPRHLGVHSGGMVLTRRPIGEIMPVEWATAEGRSVLQGDKDDCAAAGLVKIDLLGLGMLSALHTACDLIAGHHGVRLDLASIPPEDPEVYAMIARAYTVGVFQVESRAQIATLPRLRPENFHDLVVAVSLIRPGPIQGGSVHPYLRRRAGREEITYPHPLARPALERSLGVALWQEQAMRLAIDCAGFSAGRADQLRKALAAKHSVERVARLRETLLRGMRERGIGKGAAEEIYRMIEAFSDYGFPESHAQSMAHLVYASAWIRRYYPAAFTAALLASQPMGFYSPLSLVGDARRHGVTVRGVDIHASHRYAGLEPDPGSAAGQPAIRLGLGTVRGLSARHAERIVSARPFTGMDDLAHRARLPARVLENLAAAGALACLGPARRDALWTAGALTPRRQDTLPGIPVPGVPAGLPPMTPVEQTFADLRTTGASPDSHPVEHLRPRLARLGAQPAAAVRELPDRAPVLLGGLVTHRQRPPTAKGVCFLNVEDESGMINVIVPPPVLERYEQILVAQPFLLIHGIAERAQGTLNVLAHRLEPLRPPGRDSLAPVRRIESAPTRRRQGRGHRGREPDERAFRGDRLAPDGAGGDQPAAPAGPLLRAGSLRGQARRRVPDVQPLHGRGGRTGPPRPGRGGRFRAGRGGRRSRPRLHRTGRPGRAPGAFPAGRRGAGGGDRLAPRPPGATGRGADGGRPLPPGAGRLLRAGGRPGRLRPRHPGPPLPRRAGGHRPRAGPCAAPAPCRPLHPRGPAPAGRPAAPGRGLRPVVQRPAERALRRRARRGLPGDGRPCRHLRQPAPAGPGGQHRLRRQNGARAVRAGAGGLRPAGGPRTDWASAAAGPVRRAPASQNRKQPPGPHARPGGLASTPSPAEPLEQICVPAGFSRSC